ncbi:SMP-30/gluconolactonase/LRE family protein [Gordonia sp. NPDC058843]|uniref:SMP-30/gluconolactonase/LRE family protein n=1 Tax=Gordonia sp. NPDC058843 TaxID=3346648 RepID=UPI0036AD6F3D
MSTATLGPWRSFEHAPMTLGEGARAVGDTCVVVDLLDGVLYRVGDTVDTLASVGLPLGAVAPIEGRPSEWIAAVGTGVALLTGDALTWIARPADDAPTPMRVNDARSDPAGRFWFTSMAYDTSGSDGSLYRLDTDFAVTEVLDDLTVPNGPVFSADGLEMFIADSVAGTIYRCRLDPGGNVVDREVFARVDGSPDGMAVDTEGYVWSAIWGTSAIHRYDRSGRLAGRYELPAAQPTSIAFVPGHIVVTTAAYGLGPAARPADGLIHIARCDVAGLPTETFRPRQGTGHTTR